MPAVRKKGRRCEEFVNPSQGKKDEIIQDFPPFPRVPELRKPGETPPPPPGSGRFPWRPEDYIYRRPRAGDRLSR